MLRNHRTPYIGKAKPKVHGLRVDLDDPTSIVHDDEAKHRLNLTSSRPITGTRLKPTTPTSQVG